MGCEKQSICCSEKVTQAINAKKYTLVSVVTVAVVVAGARDGSSGTVDAVVVIEI